MRLQPDEELVSDSMIRPLGYFIPYSVVLNARFGDCTLTTACKGPAFDRPQTAVASMSGKCLVYDTEVPDKQTSHVHSRGVLKSLQSHRYFALVHANTAHGW